MNEPHSAPAEAVPDRDAEDRAGEGALVLHTSLLGQLVIPNGAGRADELEDLAQRATQYAVRARGDGTRRAYRSAWASYVRWCHDLGREPLAGDPETIAMYAVRRADAGCALSTIRVDLAAIGTAHRLAGVPLDLRDARLAPVLEGIARTKGARPQRQAAPAVPDVLRAMLAALGSDPVPGKDALLARDRAMLLLGFGAALRRSELVGLSIGDVTAVPGRGLRILVRRSKTDQQGRGQAVAIWANPAEPGFCPAAALERWLTHRHEAADLRDADSEQARAERPLFCRLTKAGRLTGEALSDKAVVRLVKQAATATGLDPARFSGHSLRAGLATAAGDAGAGLAELMRQTRHRSTDVALGYLRPADLWRNNVTEKLFGRPKDEEDG